MNESALLPAELEAIQAAIREAAVPAPRVQPRPLPLTPVDRAMSVARAELLELATRWVELAPRALKAQLPGTWQLRITEIELVEGPSALAELRGGWCAAAGRSGHGPAVLALAIHGAIIEAVAARRCGDARGRDGAGPVRRPPTAAAVRLFDPTGQAVLESWLDAWNQRGQGELAALATTSGGERVGAGAHDARRSTSGAAAARGRIDAAPTGASSSSARRGLDGHDAPGTAAPVRGAAGEAALGDLGGRGALLRVSLAWSGSVQGRCQIVVMPAALAPLIEDAAPADTHAALERLAEVQVELSVELGTLQLPFEQLRRLQPGACYALPTFVDAPVPIFVGGVLKAWGTPVVHRGVLAVTVEQVVGGRGGAR